MSASLPSPDRGSENRRTTRVVHTVPITVRSMDALGQAFEEFTSTVTVNCNGCKYESKHYVPKGSQLTVEIGPRKRGESLKIFPARVVWVQRPRTYREVFHIAVEFEVPGNVWDIKSPPEDWFPHPDDEELVVPVYTQADESDPSVISMTEPLEQESGAGDRFANSHAVRPPETPSNGLETAEHPSSSGKNGLELEAARQIVRSNVEAAMTQEMPLFRQQLELQLRESVRETVKSFTERLAERIANAVVEQTADRAAAMVAEGRAAYEGDIHVLEEKIRSAAREALGWLPEGPRKLAYAKRRKKSSKIVNSEGD